MIMTEILLLLSKAVASAIGKVVGSSASSRWDRKRLNQRLDEIAHPAVGQNTASTIIEKLSAHQADQLRKYLESEQLTLAAERIACSLFSSRQKREKIQDSLKNQICEALRLELPTVGAATLQSISDLIYDNVTSMVSAYILETKAVKYSPLDAVAHMIPSATRRVAAGERNATILSEIGDLAQIKKFMHSLQQQIMHVHGKIKVPHSASNRLVPLGQLFVVPQLSFQDGQQADLAEVMKAGQHTILLGDPGGGKSTLAQKATLDIAAGMQMWNTSATVPFFVVLRELIQEFIENRRTFVQHLEGLCRSPYNLEPPINAVEYLMLNGHAHLILDGLDELLDVSLRSRLVEAIQAFVGLYPDVPMLVTSRRIGYDEAPLDPDLFIPVTLGSFGNEAVAEYAGKWFRLDETTPEPQREGRATAFMQESELVADLRANPLMLALMCSIYSAENYIPRNRPDVYEKCSVLLFERWDKERNIVVRLPFDAHVRSALYALALWVYKEKNEEPGVERHKIVAFIRDYLHGRRFESREEAENAADQFIDFCTGRAWVLTDIGSGTDQSQYGFTHRTFMEYFAAKQISRDHTSPKSLFDYLLPSVEQAEGDVVAQIAVQLLGQVVADGADDFLMLLRERADMHEAGDEKARNVMSFACRLLGFIIPRPSTLRAITRHTFGIFEAEATVSPYILPVSPIYDLTAAALENLPVISAELTALLKKSLSNPGLPADQVLALAAFPAGFAAAGTQKIVSESNLEYWRKLAPELRLDLENALNRNAENLPKRVWLKHYMFARGLLPASQIRLDSANRRDGFFNRDRPRMVSNVSLATGLLAHMAGVGHELRDEITLPRDLSPDAASELTSQILAVPFPWKRVSRADSREILDPAFFARAELSPDPEVNGLYALLAAMQTDHAVNVKPGLSQSDRWEYWNLITGHLFEGFSPESLPVSARVRGFFGRWLLLKTVEVGISIAPKGDPEKDE